MPSGRPLIRSLSTRSGAAVHSAGAQPPKPGRRTQSSIATFGATGEAGIGPVSSPADFLNPRKAWEGLSGKLGAVGPRDGEYRLARSPARLRDVPVRSSEYMVSAYEWL